MQCENAIMLMKFQFYAITNQAHLVSSLERVRDGHLGGGDIMD